MDHAETDGAKTEPSERRNDGRRFANSRVIGPRSEVEQVYSYTGTQWDVETAVYYYRHRTYHSQLGRFASRDPVAYAAEEFNFYRYVGGNPLTRTDSTGLWGVEDCKTECYRVCGDQYPHWWQYHLYVGCVNGCNAGCENRNLFGWGYGNYCGWSRRGQGGPPIDAIDAACKRHDECQATWWTCNPYHLIKCSTELCNEAVFAIQSGCAQSWPVSGTMRDACIQAARQVRILFCMIGWEIPPHPFLN